MAETSKSGSVPFSGILNPANALAKSSGPFPMSVVASPIALPLPLSWVVDTELEPPSTSSRSSFPPSPACVSPIDAVGCSCEIEAPWVASESEGLGGEVFRGSDEEGEGGRLAAVGIGADALCSPIELLRSS